MKRRAEDAAKSQPRTSMDRLPIGAPVPKPGYSREFPIGAPAAKPPPKRQKMKMEEEPRRVSQGSTSQSSSARSQNSARSQILDESSNSALSDADVQRHVQRIRDKDKFGQGLNWQDVHETFLKCAGLEQPDVPTVAVSLSATIVMNPGSQLHDSLFCAPCRLAHQYGCTKDDCPKCHLCPEREFQDRRRKLRELLQVDSTSRNIYAEYVEFMRARREQAP